ncbi:MAG: EamA family transporter [Leptolyngbyaceae cyanobacterium MO_188.B28]|nr:EamA family transporter [Leptolyngbyaceae cyanobacterium MO_188.B28]
MNLKRLPSSVSLPPLSLVLLAIGSTQIGSASAKALFQEAGPAGVVFLRVGFAAAFLFLLWRPQWRSQVRDHLGLLILFGLALALMNFSFYAAIDRIPVGIAVALEFIGPLGLAIVKSRRVLDILWVLLAGAGIVLLTPIGGFALDLWGVGLALLSGCLWAAYILLSVRTGRALAGEEGLAWAMAIGALVLAPVGIAAEGATLLQPQVWLPGLGVALLSSAIPYSLELEALRSLPIQVFGVLLSLEPVAAAIAGFLILGETLEFRAIAAILLVTIAAAGTARFSRRSQI